MWGWCERDVIVGHVWPILYFVGPCVVDSLFWLGHVWPFIYFDGPCVAVLYYFIGPYVAVYSRGCKQSCGWDVSSPSKGCVVSNWYGLTSFELCIMCSGHGARGLW